MGVKIKGKFKINNSNINDFVPPSDWLDITNPDNNEILMVVNDQSPAIAFAVTTVSGSYTIDWGDGTIETDRVSNTTYQHSYTEGTGTPCSEGYTTFKIKITGGSSVITSFKVRRHNLTVFQQNHAILYANISNVTGLTTCSYMFCDSTNKYVVCRSLRSVIIPISWGNVTSCEAMFMSCASLTNIKLPSSWGNVNTVKYMFAQCSTLRHILLPSSWDIITNCQEMFIGCNILTNIILPSSWGLVWTIVSMFDSCTSLYNIQLPNNFGNITFVNNFINFCYPLKNNTNFRYLGSLTQQCGFQDAFNQCENIQGTVTLDSLISKLGFYGTVAIPLKLTGLRLTNTGSTFTGVSPQIDVSYTSLGLSALVDLFNDLPTLVSKTINITGCPGSSLLTPAERLIATNKGWSIIG